MEAVEGDDVEEARLFINQGSWINAQSLLVVAESLIQSFFSENTDSCLHIAVRHTNAAMVDLLIRSGADRALLNNDYKTAEDLIAEDLTNAERAENSQQVIKVLNVLNVFVALHFKKYYRKVPHLLPTSDFRIYVFASCKKKSVDSFKEQFDKNLTDDLLDATHVVVPTDEKGVYEPNDVFVDEFSVIFG